MRWPIHYQLLLPMVLVVALAVAVSSLTGAYLSGRWARREQRQRLSRVVETLTEAHFPLTENVLRQMTGLSGAEFAVLDEAVSVEASTIDVDGSALQAAPRVGTSVETLARSPTLRIDGRSYFAMRLALRRIAQSGDRSLVVLYPEQQWWTAARQAAYPSLMAGAAAILAAVLATVVLSRRFVRPMQQLSRHVATIAEGVFEPMSLPHRNDEYRDLAVSINTMAAQLAHYEEHVKENERLRTLGQLGAGMAHQLRNWVTGARMALEFHRRDCSAAAGEDSFAVAQRQMSLMESYLRQFLTFGHDSPGLRETLDLGALAEEATSLLGPTANHGKVALHKNLPEEPLHVLGNRQRLRQLMVNLLLNAIEAAKMEAGRPSMVRIELHKQDGQERLGILDNGNGPSPDIEESLFDPFVTGKPDGTGLGLSVARQIAEEHNATLDWHRQNGLTCFTVTFPSNE